MSLARAALRISAVRALRGETLAGTRVYDSMSQRLDNRIQSERQPIVSVYTDDHRDAIAGRGDVLSTMPVVDLILEIAVSESVAVVVDGETLNQVVIPQTDAGMELILDLLERQCIAALTTGSGNWASIWRCLAANVSSRVSRRGVFDETGGRFAARQVTMSVDTLLDPVKGASFGDGAVWTRLVDMLESDPDLAPVASLVKTELGVTPVADPALAAGMLGVDVETAEALGLGAMQGGGETAATLTDFDILEGVPDA